MTDYKKVLVGPDTPFAIGEAFKEIRTNMLYTARDVKCPVYAITSAFAHEGKSVLLANLAAAFAGLGKRVLLIDADLRNPAQHKVFSLDRSAHGLSEALAGIDKAPLETCVQHVEGSTLDVMICGHIPPNPSELLSSFNMQRMIEEAKERYDYILVDLPPILETSDAGVLAPLVSAYMVVARAGFSRIDAVCDAVSTMQSMHATVAGCILNDINTKSRKGYYSTYGRLGKYGAYNRYAKYAQTEDESEAE